MRGMADQGQRATADVDRSTHTHTWDISMKTVPLAICAMFLALMTSQPSQSADAPTAPPIAGIGVKVYKGDTSIGQIEDVMIDLESAKVSAVILSVGGFLGMGDKLVAVPVTQIKVGSEARFMTDLTKDQLTNAPAFVFANLK
jgi:uncharacterized protein YrrD